MRDNNIAMVIALMVVIIGLIIMVVIIPSYPHAKYIKINRVDNNQKYIAIKNIEAFDENGKKIDISYLTGTDSEIMGYPNNLASTTTRSIFFVNNETITPAMMRTSITDTNAGNSVGPCIGGLTNEKAADSKSNIIYVLTCPSNISKIVIHSLDDDISKRNLQNISVELLDHNKDNIEGTLQTTPISNVLKSIYYFIYQ